MFGCYFPVYDNSVRYADEICAILGYIQSVISNHPECKVCLLGDFNFDLKSYGDGSLGYIAFSDFLKDYKLVCTDALESSDTGFTYYHDTLGHYSWLDHFFLDSSLFQNVNELCIKVDACNTSDHMPVSLTLGVPGLSVTAGGRSPVIREFRWDHGNLGQYYDRTYDLLNNIEHTCACLRVPGGKCFSVMFILTFASNKRISLTKS